MSYASKEQIKELMEYVGGNLHLPQLISHFDKSMIFSEDEQMVGQWIDLKPIYKKTIVGTMPSDANNAKTISIGTSIDMVIDYEAYLVRTGSIFQKMGSLASDTNYSAYGRCILTNNSSSTPNVIILRTSNSDWYNMPVYVTVYYTKTTDSPLTYKLGTENDYSTEERLIGTWIDGKALYQKTIIDNIPTATVDGNEVKNEIDISGLSIDHIVDSDIIMENPNGNGILKLNHYRSISSTSKLISTRYWMLPSNMAVLNSDTGQNGKIFYATLKYTKV